MSTAYCRNCGAAVGTAANFCRRCGALLAEPTTKEELCAEPDWDWEVTSFRDVEDVAKIAIPDNFRDFALDDLRRRVIQAIWIRSIRIDPFSTFGVSLVNTQPDPRMKTFDPGNCSYVGYAPLRSNSPIEQYHLVWSNGLISHAGLTSEESVRIRAVLATVGYQVDPCDCDKVEYVRSETSPGFVHKR